MKKLKKGAQMAQMGLAVANDVSNSLGYDSLQNMAIDQAAEYAVQQGASEGLTNKVSKLGKKQAARQLGGKIKLKSVLKGMKKVGKVSNQLGVTDYLIDAGVATVASGVPGGAYLAPVVSEVAKKQAHKQMGGSFKMRGESVRLQGGNIGLTGSSEPVEVMRSKYKDDSKNPNKWQKNRKTQL
jgi:hypothetical protein